MTEAVTLPEPDRVEGAPHPRETARLFGQEAAEHAFLSAYAGGRLHHGWLLTGPRGVGKATLAWRIARFLRATPVAEAAGGLFGDDHHAPDTLDIAPDHPVVRRIRAGAEQGLFLLRRGPNEKGDRLSAEIRIDEVRKLRNFLHLSAADGGRRVAIVDSADEMNPAAANALLKLLEEPPPDTVLLLVSHQPSGLLPTIRSRCRELRLTPLPPAALVSALDAAGIADTGPEGDAGSRLATLAAGSAGEAVRLANLDGLATYQQIVDLFSDLPRMNRPKAIALAESAQRRGAEGRLDLLLTLVDLFLVRLARAGVLAEPAPEAARHEAALFARLSPDQAAAREWAGLQQTLGARARHGQAVNLDPAALLLDMVFTIEQTAARLSQ